MKRQSRAAIAHFVVTELTLDDPKRMLHLDPYTGFELFGLFAQRAPRRVLLRLALAWAHRHMPLYASGFRPSACPLVTGVCKHDRFFYVQKTMPLSYIIDVG
jgi:hypothetical protein